MQGALTIVGLDGVTQFAEAVESLLDDLEQQTTSGRAEDAIALAQTGTDGHCATIWTI